MIPAHPFESALRATDNGLIDDPMCGYSHRIDDASGVFCTATADKPVHNGSAWTVRVVDTEDENS
jgi:hypothetical protein